MELKALTESVVELFGVNEVCDLANALREAVLNQDTKIMDKFANIVDGDLSIDWIQKIFQYYGRTENKRCRTTRQRAWQI